jgi:hypothetical protein
MGTHIETWWLRKKYRDFGDGPSVYSVGLQFGSLTVTSMPALAVTASYITRRELTIKA